MASLNTRGAESEKRSFAGRARGGTLWAFFGISQSLYVFLYAKLSKNIKDFCNYSPPDVDVMSQ
ncbi:MAG: hypothetical protein OXE84_06680 [Rhodobacteraceae bacterium]|nr:hypothetical protein [Paracoccaceae bacterium]MCY4197579.1 hypothetical protein [Paracoccaceae bacterium]